MSASTIESADVVHTVRLQSTPFCHAPDLLQWARAGYGMESRRGGAVGHYLAYLAEGYRLGTVLAEGVLRGDVSAQVDGSDVVLHLLPGEYLRYLRAHGANAHSERIEPTPALLAVAG